MLSSSPQVISWPELHEWMQQYKKAKSMTILEFLSLCQISQTSYYKSLACSTGGTLNPSLKDSTVGKKFFDSVLDVKEKVESRGGFDGVEYLTNLFATYDVNPEQYNRMGIVDEFMCENKVMLRNSNICNIRLKDIGSEGLVVSVMKTPDDWYSLDDVCDTLAPLLQSLSLNKENIDFRTVDDLNQCVGVSLTENRNGSEAFRGTIVPY